MARRTRRSAHRWASAIVAVILLATLLSVPLHQADAGCTSRTPHTITQPFTVNTERSFSCNDLVVQAGVTVASSGVFTIKDSTLEVADGGASITVLDGGHMILEGTSFDGNGLVVEDSGQVDRLLQVHVAVTDADGDVAGADVWAWDGNGSLQVTDAGDGSLLLPITTHLGDDITHHLPWRIAAEHGGAANQTIITSPPSDPGPLDASIQLPADDDDADPDWVGSDADLSPEAGRFISTAAATLVWNPATDATDDHPHRAVDHYEVRHQPPGQSPRTLIAGATEDLVRFEVDDLIAGTHVFDVRPVDLAGNIGPYSNETVVTVDAERPTMTLRVAPPLPTGQNGWYQRAPTVTIDAQDDGESGLQSTKYRLGGTTWTEYTDPVEIKTSGDHLFEVRVTDRAGNAATTQTRIPVDLHAPAVSLGPKDPANGNGWHAGPVQIRVDVMENASGVQSLTHRIGNGIWTSFQEPLVLSSTGVHELRVKATDRAGNPSEEASLVVRIDAEPPMAPAAGWQVLSDGRVQLDWTQAPPTDLVSGVAHVFVDRLTDDGDLAHRMEVPVNGSVHAVGPFATGQYGFQLTVQDMAGNEASGDTTSLTITTSTLGLHSETQEAVARGVVPVTFTSGGDFTATEVRFYIDGALVTTMDGPTATLDWDSRDHPDGSATIRVVAMDAAGHELVAEQVYQIRNAYGAVAVDHVFILAGLIIGAAGVAVLGVLGLRRWGAWQESGGDDATVHAYSSHAPTHLTVESAKTLHLAGVVVAALVLVASVVAPAAPATLSVGAIVVGALIVLLLATQGGSIALLAVRQRRIEEEPHLRRVEPRKLHFDKGVGEVRFKGAEEER